jgi:cytochrome c553
MTHLAFGGKAMRREIFLAALIVERPMCLHCIGRASALDTRAAAMTLAVIDEALHIRQKVTCCLSCHGRGTTYFLERPANT